MLAACVFVYKFHFNAVKYFKPDLADNSFLLCLRQRHACMLRLYKLKKHDKKVRRLSVFFFLQCSSVFIFIRCNYFQTTRVRLVFGSHSYESLPCRRRLYHNARCRLECECVPRIKFIHILFTITYSCENLSDKTNEPNQCV